MDDPDGYFGEPVAAGYDDPAGRMFQPEVIDPAVSLLAELAAGGEAIAVTIGDMATTRVDGSFSLAYLVFNTINNLTTQEAQVACFRNVAAHLAAGGCFVIETGVPPLRRLPPGQDIQGYQAGSGRIVSYTFDHSAQQYRGHYVQFTDGIGQYRTIPFRYVWPSELDLMAQLAGLRLRDRWAGWNREPYTTDSQSHVSVWEKPAT